MKHYKKHIQHLIVVRNGNFGGPIAELTDVGYSQMKFVGKTIIKAIIYRFIKTDLSGAVSIMCPQQSCFIQSAEIISSSIGIFNPNSVKSFQNWPRVDSALIRDDFNQLINSAVVEFGNIFTILVLPHNLGEDYCKYFMKHHDIKSYKNLDVGNYDHGFVIWINGQDRSFYTFGVPSNHSVMTTVEDEV